LQSAEELKYYAFPVSKSASLHYKEYMKPISSFIISTLLLLSLVSTGWAQTATDSKAGLFVAFAEKTHRVKTPQGDVFGTEIKIYSTALKAHIQSIFIKQDNTFEMDTMYFSPKGGLIVATIKRNGRNLYGEGCLYNTLSGRMILSGINSANRLMAFMPDDSRFFVREGNFIDEINVKDRKKITEYKFTEQEWLTQLYVTGDEKYLIAQTTINTWVWDLHSSRPAKKYKSMAHAYDDSRGIITILSSFSNDLSCSSIHVASGKLIGKNKISSVLKKLEFKLDSLSKEQANTGGTDKKAAIIVKSGSARLSHNGNFIALECNLRGIDKNMVLLVNNVTKAFSLLDQEQSITPSFTWAGDSTFLFRKNAGEYLFGNPRSESSTYIINPAFEFGKSKNERIIPAEKQPALSKWSNDYRYIALPDKFKGVNRIYLRPALIKQEKSLADSAQFLCFSQNSNALYILGTDDRFGYISTEDIEGDIGIHKLPKTFFSDSLIIPIQSEILHDPIAPVGYYFPKITSFKHISEANASTPLHIYLKTMSFDGKDNSLQVHLIDTNGVYYYGASEAAWKKIWCNLLLIEPEKVRQIQDFGVTEYREDTSFYNGMCVALDFSGSMGSGRGHLLQKGVLKFIGTKLQHEGIGVIKYDSRVVDECEMTQDKDMLTQNMNKTPYEKLATATALLDALDHSINLLDASSGYENKFIILLTDGCENASLVTKKYIIEKAVKNNIRIFTIGLGEYVSEGYLKSISYNTQGSYYRIYNSENLEWIYQDIRNKIKNYYTIKFRTEKENASYKALLNICLDNKYKDTLSVVFDNTAVLTKLKLVKLKTEKIEAPFSQIKNSKSDSLWKGVQVMEDFSQVITQVAIPLRFQQHPELMPKPLSRQDSTVEEAFNALEFPAIKFEFDKTIIVKGTDEGIDNVVKFMKEHPKLKIEIQGHTDNRGSDEHNIPLSQARADVVKAILVGKGLPADRMTAKGYGSTQPLVPNTTEENRQINRRIDFKITEH
jgi:outer membrane protein OmpA-like peptidoglycan-associated protein/uncharacterized protein YegL